MDLKSLIIHKDPRGMFIEAFKLPTDGQVSYIIINPHQTRGGHYHLKNIETFLVIYGAAELSVKNRETDDVMKVEVSGYKPMTITVLPNHTHEITATDEGAIVMVWASEQFDPKNPDTYPEEL